MSEGALLQAIAAEPDEDVHRLVYADWLEDQGKAEQAEFVRLQCELARLEEGSETADRRAALQAREHRLRARGGKGWAGRWLRRALPHSRSRPAWEFRRGLVEVVALTPAGLLRLADELFARHPVRLVRLAVHEGLADLAGCRHLARLNGLEVSGLVQAGAAGLDALLRSPHLGRLRELALQGWGVSRVALDALAGCPQLAHLTRLDLSGCPLPLGGMFAGATLPRLLLTLADRPLRELSLGPPNFGEDVLPPLAGSGLAGRLRALTLNHVTGLRAPAPGVSPPSPTGLRAVVAGIGRLLRPEPARYQGPALEPLLGGLTTLRLRSCAFQAPPAVNDLLAQPALANLTTLEVSGVPSGRAALAGPALSARALAGPHLARLTTLILPRQRLGDTGAAVLSGAANLSALTTLDLAHNNLSSGAVPSLALSGHLPRLRWLSLRGNALGPGSLAPLLSSDLPGRLWWLDLRRCGLQDRDALDLAESAPLWGELAWLDLRANTLSRPVRQRLRQAFGQAVRYDTW
jgi:uncharacterized protein (TIGR02996 family)